MNALRRALPPLLLALAACGDTLIDHDGTVLFPPGGLTCDPPTHACGQACVLEGPDSCGASCEVCAGAPADAVPICAAHACGFECNPGWLRCGSGCCRTTAVAAGGRHTCAATSATTVRCWGANDAGQLGDGTTADRPAPVDVSGLSGASAVAAGARHSCAVVAGGVSCWGDNASGQLGRASPAQSTVPLAVAGLSGVVAVGAGDRHGCALTSGGVVSCWGANEAGQLGRGTSSPTPSPAPAPVAGIAGATALAVGLDHACALLAGGEVRCWGANGSGQLGDGSATARPTPVTPVASGAISVAAGDLHSCAGLSAGGGRCWGANASGQLGSGTAGADQASPVAIQVSASFTLDVPAGGGAHTCAVRSGDGSVKCWGANTAGQLANGTTVGPEVKPVDSLLILGVAAVSAGTAHTCALLSDGSVKCAGANDRGQLGTGTLVGSPTPASPSGR